MAVNAQVCISGQITDEQVTVTVEHLAIFCVLHQLISTECLSVEKRFLVGYGTPNFVRWCRC